MNKLSYKGLDERLGITTTPSRLAKCPRLGTIAYPDGTKEAIYYLPLPSDVVGDLKRYDRMKSMFIWKIYKFFNKNTKL